MISNISRLITLHLSPLLYLTSIILAIFALVGPVPATHTSIGLVAVYPATPASLISQQDFDRVLPRAAAKRVVQANSFAASVDGPTVRIGPLGSCGRSNNAAQFKCGHPSFNPTYDYSSISSSAPISSLPLHPTSATPILLLTSIVLAVLFLILHIFISLPDRGFALAGFLGRIASNHLMVNVAAWTGVSSFVIGLMSTIIWRVAFGTRVDDFNERIAELGSKAPQLVAGISNGFTLMWLAYAFAAPAIICSLIKLQLIAAVKAGKA